MDYSLTRSDDAFPLLKRPPYTAQRCIQCLANARLTEEHVFADGAGGYLTAYILCEPCNRHFGRNIDAPYLKQSFVQVARNAHRLGGRRGNIPQPFQGPHTVAGPSGDLQIKLDADFKPRVIPQIEDISITPEGGLAIAFTLDASERDKIPALVRSKFERFFKSTAGLALDWSPDAQEHVILSAITQYEDAPTRSTPTGELASHMSTDLHCLFLEAAKVALEVAAIEDEEQFVGSPQAARFRTLLASIRDGKVPTISQFEELLRAFEATTFRSDLELLPHVAALANRKADALHIAALQGRHVVVAMFGIAFLFRDLRANHGHGAIYSNCVDSREVRYLRT